MEINQLELLIQGLAVEDLDPITVRILNKSQSHHAPLIGLLDEFYTHFLESIASRIYIRNHQSNVPKSAGFRVAIVVLLFSILFGSPIVGQLQGSLSASSPLTPLFGILRNIRRVLISIGMLYVK